MPMYVWKGTNPQGKTQKGEIEAKDEASAQQLLKRQNITSATIKPKPKDILENIEFLQPKVSTKDLILFTRQFSTMIDAGLPLMQGLEILATQCENPTFKKILVQIKNLKNALFLALALLIEVPHALWMLLVFMKHSFLSIHPLKHVRFMAQPFIGQTAMVKLAEYSLGETRRKTGVT
jgi:type II secretory pathway component PulF